jgi:hypothetical protein
MSIRALILRDEKDGEFSRVREIFHPEGFKVRALEYDKVVRAKAWRDTLL